MTKILYEIEFIMNVFVAMSQSQQWSLTRIIALTEIHDSSWFGEFDEYKHTAIVKKGELLCSFHSDGGLFCETDSSKRTS